MIFTSEKVKIFRKRLKKQTLKGAPYWGVSRRATNLLPAPVTTSDVLLKGAAINGYSNLLLSLEANQKSGCLIIQSDKNKSRSGILIFRGRILGCMYGQKNLKNYLFEGHAYEKALHDLQGIRKTVDVYGLKDEIVIAASALFHGPAFEEPDMPPAQFFEEVQAQLLESAVPGCIVMTDKTDDATLIVYIFAGQIVGVHSSRKGWLQADKITVQKYLNKYPQQRIQACILPCRNVVEVNQYSFSLSGLGDREFRKMPPSGKYDILNIFYLLRMDKTRLEDTRPQNVVRIDRFMPRYTSPHHKFMTRLQYMGEAFSVRP
jgi:hypothetical protein